MVKLWLKWMNYTVCLFGFKIMKNYTTNNFKGSVKSVFLRINNHLQLKIRYGKENQEAKEKRDIEKNVYEKWMLKLSFFIFKIYLKNGDDLVLWLGLIKSFVQTGVPFLVEL